MQSNILNETYQVQKQLSQRGGRETLLVTDLHTKQLAIIKLLKFGLDSEWEDFKLFAREAQTLRNLNHPAIPNYLDYFELDLPHAQGFALVQEYINAPSIEKLVKDGRNFNELEIEQIAKAMLNILLDLHQRQPSIIHRDIKPSNILLSDRSGNSVGQVYLVDFGAVKNITATEGGTITVVGTYGYMPPEQFGGQTTPASDLYSLGATLIYLATGRHPTELPSKGGKIEFESVVSLKPSLVSWLRKMTEPSLDFRFSCATEALYALKHPLVKTEDTEISKQPRFSRIVLRKTAKEISVLVPPQGFTAGVFFLSFFALFWNGFLVVWTGVGAFSGAPLGVSIVLCLSSIPFWLIGFSLIGSILFTLLGKTRLRITSEQISLTYECLGIKYQKPKPTSRQNITAIECTGKTWQTDRDGNKTQISSAVVVWANYKPYSLGTSVVKNKNIMLFDMIFNYDAASVELNWLAQELSQWLNIPLSKRKVKRP